MYISLLKTKGKKFSRLKLDKMAYFVVRDTEHPAEDLARNWSSTVGGVNWDGRFAFETLEAANESDPDHEYRFHPAHDGFAVVDYEGLGAFCLESEDLADAIEEAAEYGENLACCEGSGDGHFFAEDVISFHKISDERYIFQIRE